MFINRKFKYFVLILLLIVFGILIYYSVVTNNYRIAKEVLKNEINVEEIKEKLKEENKLDLEIKLNDNQTYYNIEQDAYFYCVDVKEANTYKNLKLKILSKEKYKYIIVNDMYDKEKGFYIDFVNPIDIIIYNEELFYQTQIKFSSVPIVNIITENVEPIDYQGVQLELFSQNYKDKTKMMLVESEAQMKIRGGTSWYLPKKQYKISLTYGDKKNNLSLLGMNKDEDYILEAMYGDYSKIRSKLAFDIWNQMNSYNVDYPEVDVNSEYVEVYMNQQYHGLYTLKEFVDWKKVGVNEFTENNTGIVIKGFTYSAWNQEVYDREKVLHRLLRI